MQPRQVDTAGMDAEQLRLAVLRECHAGLQGLLRCSGTVLLPGGEAVQVFCDLPQRLRAQWPGARMRVLDGDGGFAVDAGSHAARPLDDAERQRLLALRTLLDAALLGPLYRAERCERDGGLLRAITDDGTWTVTLQQLVPTAIDGPHGKVRILDWLKRHNPQLPTWIPCRAESAPLGNCELQWGDEAMVWDDGFFAPPPDAKVEPPKLVLTPDGRARPRPNLRPQVPVEAQDRAAQWVVLDDPGDWAARAELFARHYQELERQHQFHAGFVGFLVEDGRARMIVPFRRRDGGDAFAAPAGWQLREIPARKVLEVYPPAGSFEQRVAAGTAQLQQALAERGLGAAGPILAQPFLDLQDGVPPAAKLQAPVVRVSVPVR